MAVYCPNCGRKLPDGASFCDQCGMQITAPAAKKKSSGAFVKLLLTAAVLCAAAFGGMALWEKIYHRTPPEDPSSMPDSETLSVLPDGEDVETEKKEDGDTAQGIEAMEPPQDNTEPENSAPASEDVSQGIEQMEPQDTAETETQENSTPASDDTAQGILKPAGEPRFDDFLFYENDVYANGIPADAALLSAAAISGEWKYCMTFNRLNEGEERIDEIGLAEVSFTGDTAQLILHPVYIRYGTHVEPENEAEVGYTPFTGTWDNEYIDVKAGGTSIGLGPYYSHGGSEYVLGNIVVKDSGMFGDVLLVRP